MWHPYKYTFTVAYCLFSPLMVAFSHGIQATDVPMYAFPKLIFMERMFACFFVSASKNKISIQQKLGLLHGRCEPPMLASSNGGRLLC